jgi:hypothetical protein
MKFALCVSVALVIVCAAVAAPLESESADAIGQRVMAQLQQTACGFTDATSGLTYDFSALQNAAADYSYDGTGTVSNQKWMMNICQNTKTTCSTATTPGIWNYYKTVRHGCHLDVLVVIARPIKCPALNISISLQNLDSQSPTACYQLGTLASAAWSTLPAPTVGVSLKYSGGSTCYSTQPYGAYSLEVRL